MTTSKGKKRDINKIIDNRISTKNKWHCPDSNRGYFGNTSIAPQRSVLTNWTTAPVYWYVTKICATRRRWNVLYLHIAVWTEPCAVLPTNFVKRFSPLTREVYSTIKLFPLKSLISSQRSIVMRPTLSFPGLHFRDRTIEDMRLDAVFLPNYTCGFSEQTEK